MDTDTLVSHGLQAGQRLLGRLTARGFDVTAAAWIRKDDARDWHLYIASRTIGEKGLPAAYQEAFATLQALGDPSLSFLGIKLIEATHPIARDVLDLRRRYHGGVPVRFQPQLLGGAGVEEVYVYPALPTVPGGKPLTSSEVEDRVFELLRRGNGLGPSTVTLRDGASFQGTPVGLERTSGGPMSVTFIDAETHLPRIHPADEVAAID